MKGFPVNSENQGKKAEFSLQLLRSPREELGGYVILPRLIDKIRLKSKGILPPDYMPNLLRLPDPEKGLFPFDGRFLRFAGIDPERFETVVLEKSNDQEILAWVEQQGIRHSLAEKETWRRSIEQVPPSDQRTAHRIKAYPGLAHRKDLGLLSPFDLIDLDEGRKP